MKFTAYMRCALNALSVAYVQMYHIYDISFNIKWIYYVFLIFAGFFEEVFLYYLCI